MRFSDLFSAGVPRELRNPTTSGQSGPIWRTIVLIVMGIVGGTLMANLVLTPSKRNVELFAGILFLGIVLIAHPFKALLFTMVVLPFPASTSVGTTSTLLILALLGLIIMKAPMLKLSSPFFRRDADLAIMGYVLMVFLSLYKQDMGEPARIMELTLGMLSAIALYYIVIQLATDMNKFMTLFKLSQVLAFVLAIIANLQSAFPTRTILPAFFKFSRKIADMGDVRAGEVRAFATFNGYEVFAEYCAISIILQYFLFRNATDLRQKAFWGTSIIALTLALFSTGTRAGVLILVVGAVYLLLVSGRVVRRSELLKVGFVALTVFYLSLPFIGSKVEMMFSRFETLGSEDSSVQSRTGVLGEALEMIPDSPILGHGIYAPLGTFTKGSSQHIHNLYVTLLYKFGIPGLVAFVWFLSILVRISYTDSRGSPGHRSLSSEMMLALHVTLVMWILDEIKIEYTRAAMTMHLVWFHFGLIMALHKIKLSGGDAGTPDGAMTPRRYGP